MEEPIIGLRRRAPALRQSLIGWWERHGRHGQGPVAACRGSTALPAASDQSIALQRFRKGDGASEDRRLVLETDGRGGHPVRLMIEKDKATGYWLFHGNADDAIRQQRLVEAEESATDRQADTLELVRTRWAQGGLRTGTHHVVEHLGMTGTTAAKKVRRFLRQLANKGLVAGEKERTSTGMEVVYRPVSQPGPEPADSVSPPAGLEGGPPSDSYRKQGGTQDTPDG